MVVFINLVLYLKTLGYTFCSDDATMAGLTPPKTNWFMRQFYTIMGHWYWEPFSAHCWTLILHIIVCLLVNKVFGFYTAALFSVLPANHMVSIWISGKGYSLSAIWGLLMWIFPVLAPAFWYLNLNCFSVSLSLFPLVFIGAKYWPVSLLMVILFMHFKRIKKMRNSSGRSEEMENFYFRKIIIVIKTFGYYFKLGVTGRPLCHWHNLLSGFGLNEYNNKLAYKIDKDFWVGIITLAIFAYPLAKGWPCAWWFCINIGMWCNFITLSSQISERYMYFAAIGLCAFMVKLIFLLPAPFGICCFIFIFGWHSSRIFSFQPAYKNDFWLVEYVLLEQWDNIRTRLFRAMHKFQNKEYWGALLDYSVIYALNPYDFKILYNMANMYLALGDLEKAEEYLDKALLNIYKNGQQDTAIRYVKETREYIKQAQTEGSTEASKIRIFK